MSTNGGDGDRLPALVTATADGRLPALDLARGFALFGVLIANLHHFGTGPALRGEFSYSGVDRALHEVIGALFTGKFYPFLSFLFGFGAWLMYAKARERGVSFVTYERRLVGLALLGVLHGVLLFDGDILFTYAMVGFATLLFLPTSARTKFFWALGLIGVQMVRTFSEARLPIPVDMAWVESSSSYAHETALRAIATAAQIPGLLYVGWLILAMFLLGAAAAQQGWLRGDEAGEQRLRFLRGPVFVAGLGLGWPAGALMHSDASPTVVRFAETINNAAGPLVALGLFAWAAYFVRTHPGRLSRGLSAIGRTSLSCYLMQSFVMVVAVPALGYLQRDHALAFTVGLALVLFAMQFVGAQWWLKRFRFGPAEWFLRSFTYGQAQAMRR